MTGSRDFVSSIAFTMLAVAASLLMSAGLIQIIGRDAMEVFTTTWDGAFSSSSRVAGVFNFWIPLTLASLGLVVTFRAGLWNIGVEGQIVFGTIFATWVALFVPAPAMVRVPLAVIASMVGGGLWALVAGLLKTRLGVHEIFGGVALNAIASVLTNYLVSNRWSPEGGNALDVGQFDMAARIGSFSDDFPTSITFIVLVMICWLILVLSLNGTRWGLELKATGKNARSALLLGVATERVSLSAFMVCGALCGIAGAYRVLFTFGTLRPGVSGGIGFLGILVVLLVGYRALWVPFVTFAFAALLFGSTRLRVLMRLDASLAKTLQGLLVLLVILGNGLRTRITERRSPSGSDPVAPSPSIVTEATSYE